MKGALTKKLGPLKLYQWMLIGAAVGGVFYIYKKGHSASPGSEMESLPGAGGPAGAGGGGVGSEPAEPKLELPPPPNERPEREPNFESPPPPEGNRETFPEQSAIDKIKEAGEVVEEARKIEKQLQGKHTHSPPKKKHTTPHHKPKSPPHGHHKNPATARHEKRSHGKHKPLHERVHAPHRAHTPPHHHVHPHGEASHNPHPHRPAKPVKKLGKHHRKRTRR